MSLINLKLTLINLKLSLINLKLTLINLKLTLINLKLTLINLKLTLINLKLTLINFKLSLINLKLTLINLNLSLINLRVKSCSAYALWEKKKLKFYSIFYLIINPFVRNLFLILITLNYQSLLINSAQLIIRLPNYSVLFLIFPLIENVYFCSSS